MTIRRSRSRHGYHRGYAERFGVYNNMGKFLANSLGSEETTLFKIVAAYAMFANGGERVVPTLVDRVQDRYGKTVYQHDPRSCVDCDNAYLPSGLAPSVLSERERVMDAITAYQLTSMLQGLWSGERQVYKTSCPCRG